MKRKDLIEKIKIKANNDFKDIEIDISKIDIEEPDKNIRPNFSLRRGVALTFASIFILVTGFFIYSFNIGNTFSDETPLNSETEILGFQTVSGAALLSSYETTNVSNTDDILKPIELSQSTFDIEDELNLISDYINMSETMFGSSNNYLYNEIESDDPNYEYSFEYKGMDLAGKLIEYIGYYNKNNNNGIELVSGILVNNQRTYTFTQLIGESISKYKVYINQNNYVEVVNMSSENSQSFKYKLYKRNNLVNSSVVNISQFQNDFEANITITNTSNKELKLTVTNQSDFEGFNVRYNYDNKQSGNFKVKLAYDEESQMYKYQFEFENKTVIANRFEKGNRHVTEDDFIGWRNSQNDQITEVDSNKPGNRRNAINTESTQTNI